MLLLKMEKEEMWLHLGLGNSDADSANSIVTNIISACKADLL